MAAPSGCRVVPALAPGPLAWLRGDAGPMVCVAAKSVLSRVPPGGLPLAAASAFAWARRVVPPGAAPVRVGGHCRRGRLVRPASRAAQAALAITPSATV